MGKIINIDNGGTLTDFCALDEGKIYHTKSLTTPFDLSKCFFDGMKKLACEIYGEEDRIDELLQTTDYIRYSTTQGTNALVERKGPKLGLIVEKGADLEVLKTSSAEVSLFSDLVGECVAEIDLALEGEAAEMAVVRAVNSVASAGASRIILALNSSDFKESERQVSRIISRKFPSHLLGVLPVLLASEVSDHRDYTRRTWTATINAFLHPSMERFLYSADHRLGAYKTKNPLLIFRNDGGSARVAKTMAIKTYSSGPRGGMEGAKALCKNYGFKKLLTYDVGGTTTDIGLVTDGQLENELYGHVNGVEVGLPLANIYSAGVGGSSIITAKDDAIAVGPESVGAAPGPACFGLGGKKATITDVSLLFGLLDPSTYFGGQLTLDKERAKDAVVTQIADPLGLTFYQSLVSMRDAWVSKIAESLKSFTAIDASTTLAGFGGAGALAATKIADATGIKQVIIPGMGAVFSAFGIGFSPLSQEYQLTLAELSEAGLKQAIEDLQARAARDMYAEGLDISDCHIKTSLLRVRETEELFEINGDGLPCELNEDDIATLHLSVSKEIEAMSFSGSSIEGTNAAQSCATRRILVGDGEWQELPVYRLEELRAGAFADGPAIIEEAFFTGQVDKGWRLTVSTNKDLILKKLS